MMARGLIEYWTVEAISSTGNPLYLAYFGDNVFEWTRDDEQAWEFDDEEEARAEAIAWRGGVEKHERLATRAELALMPVALGGLRLEAAE